MHKFIDNIVAFSLKNKFFIFFKKVNGITFLKIQFIAISFIKFIVPIYFINTNISNFTFQILFLN